jgi:hypothetical protein
MKRTLTAVAAALAVLAGLPAIAAEEAIEATEAEAWPANMESCHSLESQFKAAEATHRDAKRYKEADADYREGMKLCNDGRWNEGVAKLRDALRDLGVKVSTRVY